jgi:tetratricopeptide (TPR) repeat protein
VPLNEAVVCLALLLAGTAEGPSDAARESARRHYGRGLELVSQARYEPALNEFLAAYQARPHYAALYNIGQTYIELGRPAEAIAMLERYLAEGKDRIPSERVEQVRGQITAQTALTAQLTVLPGAERASVWIDGQLAGAGGFVGPVRVNAGSHDVALSPPGTTGLHQVIVLAPGQAFELVWPGISAPEPVQPAAALGAEHAGAPPAGRESAPSTSATLGYWLGGIGLGLGAAALGHYFWNRARFDRWQSEQKQIEGGDLAGQEYFERQSENNQLAASIERASHWTVALSVAGGALFTSGVTLVVVSEGGSGARASGAVLMLQGAF